MFIFEIRKILKEKSFYFLLALFFLMLLSPVFSRDTLNDQFQAVQLKSVLKQNKENINQLADTPEASTLVKDLKEVNHRLESMLEAIEQGDKEALVKTEYELEMKNLEDTLSGKLYGRPLVEQEKTVKELHFLIENQITQVDYNKTKMPGLNYLHMTVSYGLPYTFFFIFIGLIISGIMTLEKRKYTISFYNVLPVSPLKKMFIKIASGFIYTFLGTLFLFVIVFLIFSAFEGTGSLDYPVGIITNNGEAELITLSVYLLRIFVLFSLWLLFFSCLSFLISLFTGNSAVNMSMLFFLILGAEFSPFKNDFLITSHVNFPNIVVGGSGYTEPIGTTISFPFSAGIILSYCLAILLVSYFVLKRKRWVF
ncbi:ABC transporter permease [Enterococcus sp. BWB1-3]|uniref:ABC transporter permease n=1 Tax=Enterococcus sp. BWB1-3 TaxID=2787713 RepID=UPI0019236DF7|nr:ABC transporter permease [Enterococcus sp. BWB1-3]MBL1230155.1 ABC transporter permease [Enterococcus sp. BWB1-3]